jgi:predicted transcriptional regulator
MAFPVKRVQTLEERLRIIEEVEKTPSENIIDVAKQLGLPPSTLNTIIAKKKIREHAYVSVDQELATCGVLCVVSWEVEVAWRRCKLMVVVTTTTTKPGFT